uniref:Uncharacterized protein n=1 Tax=Magallana gigas TaxID=29159 RepID=A0A8W8MIN2_MAGGI
MEANKQKITVLQSQAMLLSPDLATRARWSKVAKMDDNTTKYSPKDLIDYLFRVSAVNKEGQVSPLETKEPVRLKRKIDVLSSSQSQSV